jgi:hypothetical protein
MLRALSVFLFVSACTPATSLVRENARAPLAHSEAPTNVAASLREPRESRLAPPFGRASGVRRVSAPSEPAQPAVLAAADQD